MGGNTFITIIAIIWQIERRRWRRQEGFRVSICHEKFLLHLNQGSPPREGFLPPQEGRNPSRGGTGAQYNRRSDLPAK